MQTFLTMRFDHNRLRVDDTAAAQWYQFCGDVAVPSDWPVGGQSSAVLQTAKGLAWEGSQKSLEGRVEAAVNSLHP